MARAKGVAGLETLFIEREKGLVLKKGKSPRQRDRRDGLSEDDFFETGY